MTPTVLGLYVPLVGFSALVACVIAAIAYAGKVRFRMTPLLAVLLLAGCATFQDARPWVGVELHDNATRAAMPRWQDAGRFWVGFKSKF